MSLAQHTSRRNAQDDLHFFDEDTRQIYRDFRNEGYNHAKSIEKTMAIVELTQEADEV